MIQTLRPLVKFVREHSSMGKIIKFLETFATPCFEIIVSLNLSSISFGPQ